MVATYMYVLTTEPLMSLMKNHWRTNDKNAVHNVVSTKLNCLLVLIIFVKKGRNLGDLQSDMVLINALCIITESKVCTVLKEIIRYMQIADLLL